MRSKVSNTVQTESSIAAETEVQTPQRQSFKQTLMGWLQLDSFGGRLFWMIMVGALTGVGGMAFLFSEMVKYQAEDQVRSTLDGQVNAIASVTEAAETLANSLGISATTLHERQAQYADTYRELTLQLFERRPQFVVGLGLGQRENGLIVDQSWLFPYYWVDAAENESTPSQTSIRYEDFADNEGEFYPDGDRYRDYFLPQTSVWTEPYQTDINQLLTYYVPLFASDGRWLGTTLVDVDSQYLSDLLDQPVFRQMGNFTLLTRSGQIIADPANPENNLKSYNDIPKLQAIWPQVSLNDTGFLEGETGYWAYANVPDQDWVVIGYVPYAAVFNRIALITSAATALMIALLSTAIVLAIRSLNRRLRPVLNQCNQLAKTDSTLLAQWDTQDELNQLSLAFFNMLEQLNLREETIRRHEREIQKETLHADQVSERFTELTALLDQLASEQQTLARKIQQRMTNVTDDAQSLDIQVDAINTLGRALDGDLRRIPTHSTEILTLVEQQVESLNNVLAKDAALTNTKQLKALVNHLSNNIVTLKAIERRWPDIEGLQKQTGKITQTSQVALSESRSMLDTVQAIGPMLSKIEQISTRLYQQARAFDVES
ncbi:methyl-accepting chemotaxis protein [Leptolyngbya sp. Heron Island J]|uniref:methyl-accepting chemotaxis protein n=1 Tax=Leptolyngbya sp. Heron Island J TaxID=1385935 RepID=UPI0003B96AF1|nr:methyl-accepting chemotaxis protein [Leptolyngbya sp. Heron Island J]ESA33856.1 methyl-accepting chemotaxis protein [Leptolyngbya sp. Heron Island J]